MERKPEPRGEGRGKRYCPCHGCKLLETTRHSFYRGEGESRHLPVPEHRVHEVLLLLPSLGRRHWKGAEAPEDRAALSAAHLAGATSCSSLLKG